MFIVGLIMVFFTNTASAHFVKPIDFNNDNSDLKALVFLSHQCPCSKSHIEHLRNIIKEYPKLRLYGVISDFIDEEAKAKVMSYFSSVRFPFPIVEDNSQRLVKKYNALKTPHVTLLQKVNEKYQIIYEGGLTDQKVFNQSGTFYLAENLKALSKNQEVVYRHGFSLGCYIRRR